MCDWLRGLYDVGGSDDVGGNEEAKEPFLSNQLWVGSGR